MAEIVLCPLLQVIFDKLASPLIQKLSDVWEFKDNLQKLQQTLPRIQALLEDAEERQITDKSVRIWLSQLKDAADKAGDYLELFANQFALAKASPLVRADALKRVSFSAEKLKKVLHVLEVATAEGLNLRLRDGSSVVHRRSDGRETGSFVIDSEIYGRDEERKEIVNMLLSSASTFHGREGNVSVVPLVGIGGIGKTTLAQLIYNDETVLQHFELRMWAFVSEDFNVKRIMKSAIVSASKSTCDISEMDLMQSRLWDIIHRKKYLLVLDDVWNEDQDEWDKLWPVLQGGAKGSKIIVTARSKKVAMIMETSPNSTHRLKGLSENYCWSLFKRRAFSRGEEDRFSNLVAIGKQILTRCGGVPLAAKTLGSLLRFKREENEWLFVQNSELWNLEACHQTGIFPALLLSYLQLPSHLKHCFAFCSIFPKNYEIKKEKLILLWMAEGLILSQGGTQTMEEVGDEYFKELSWMSFFEDVKDCSENTMTTYKMNDLFYELARSLTRKDSIVLDHGNQTSSLSQIHHLSIDWGCISCHTPESLCEATHLRTLLVLFSGGKQIHIPPKLFLSLKFLRVLDLNGSDITLPDTIRDLQCLKYLDLSNTPIFNLPLGVSYLHSLQTLNLSGCFNLKRLPYLGEMTNLRHLNLAGCETLTYLPNGFDKLVQLQTLPVYIVTSRATLGALRSLNLLGELKIKNLENVRQAEEAKDANLRKKSHIHSLGLCWGYDDGNINIPYPKVSTLAHFIVRKEDPEPQAAQPPRRNGVDVVLAGEVLSCLRPHQNLMKLFVVDYPGLTFPQWMLPKLSLIVLKNCRGCFHLPTLGHLPFLKALHMEGIDNVTLIGPEFYGEQSHSYFPSLEELTIRDFPVLESWFNMDGRNLFPRLSKFTLKKCPNLLKVPNLLSLQHVELQGCKPTILDSIGKSTLLSTVTIEDFPELVSLPDELLRDNVLLKDLKISSCPKLHSLPLSLENLKSLKTLTIRWCERLSSLPKGFHKLTALVSLEITECHTITALPEEGIEGLSSLKSLSVENSRNLASLPMRFQNLTSLENLTIMYCPSLSSLPDGIQHLSALRTLTIISLPELEFLPEGLKHVTALQRLEIRSCSSLSSLPEWFENFSSLRSLAISDCQSVTSLPMAIQRLTALQHLSIHQCPDLERRCDPDGGVDFWKIAHIPHKYISSGRFRQSEDSSSST